MALKRILSVVLLCSTLTLISTAPRIASAAEYNIDIPGMHAAIQFRIYHLGYSVLTGRFTDFGGTSTWDKKNPAAPSLNVISQCKKIS